MTRQGWLVLAALLMTPATALAQLTTGTISGTVKDATEAVLPGASVTVRNVDTGLARTAVTDETGRFETPNLPDRSSSECD